MDISHNPENASAMQPVQVGQLEYVFAKVPFGVAILDATNRLIQYVNPFLHLLLDEPWCNQDVRGYCADEVLPHDLSTLVLPLLQQVARTGQAIQHAEVPYEGFLETRGRTYWRVAVERTVAGADQSAEDHACYSLLVTLEDVTEVVRSRLHLNAIHYISSAIAGPASLHLVLDRILQILQEMFGSKRCAVFLIDHAVPTIEAHLARYEDPQHPPSAPLRTATIAAQQGVHPRSQDWHPVINKDVLLNRVLQERRTLIITDTSTTPTIAFPLLDDGGKPCRPGSVLCVPIFAPLAQDGSLLTHYDPLARALEVIDDIHTDAVLGTIEVYHRHARSFPAEEVKLLERFAQQAGLAIQNARLFRSIDRWARAASRQARQKENIMQAIPDGVVIYDPRWRVADANHAARQLLDWSDDILGLPILQAMQRSRVAVQELAYPDLAAEFERRALTGQIDEFKVLGADEQTYTMRCTYTPIRDTLGDIFAFIVIYHDVTEEVAARERIEAEVVARTAELKQRNMALQQAKAAQEMTNARMSLLLKRLPSGVILVSAENTTITVINRHALRLLRSIGIMIESEAANVPVIGLSCEQLLRSVSLYNTSGACVPYEDQPLSTALVQGQACEAELHIIRQDGQIIHLLVNAAPLLAADKTVTSAILVLQEITRIKNLERAREDFFTTMAHELKTPLANIRAHLSALLARDLEWSSEEQYDFLQTADEQVDRLVGMINHFLDASRVEAGALRLELEPLLIPELLEDLSDRLEALITSSHRYLQIVAPPDLPAVVGDYELIVSVLSNLLSNAFRYAPQEDAVLLRVEPLYPAQGQPAVKFSVIDHGPGISPEQQAALFTRFSTFAAMSRPSVDRPGQPTVRAPAWQYALESGYWIGPVYQSWYYRSPQ